MNREDYDKIRVGLQPIHDLVQWASELYAELRTKSGLPCGDGEAWGYQGDIELHDTYVTTKWEHLGAYGGHSECDIPINAIIGCEADRVAFITNIVRDDSKLADEILAFRLDKQRDARIAHLVALKAEFES